MTTQSTSPLTPAQYNADVAASKAAFNPTNPTNESANTPWTDGKAPSAGKGLPKLSANPAADLSGQTNTPGQDVDSYLRSYVTQLTNLGPEYSKEMAYLAPYLTGQSGATTSSAQAQSIGQSLAGGGVRPDDLTSPVESTIDKAENALGAANVAQTPAIASAFDTAAKSMSNYEETIPYADVLSSALAYGKSQLQYEGTGANTSGWAPQMQSLYQYLSSAAGIGGVGLPGAPTVTEAQLGSAGTSQQQPASTESTPIPQSSLSGGGNG